MKPAFNPLIIAGMHRSGTSLTAAALESLGVELGDRLLGADRHNAKGYFEDLDFLDFQRQRLQAACVPGEAGWPDWGWTESEQLDRSSWGDREMIDEARAIVAQRPADTLWGWKDPRTSLMLEFWRDLLPEARFLLVYRLPWDVADSVLRIGHPVFTHSPEYGLRAWAFYNRHVLEFYQANRDRCLLFNVEAFFAHPLALAKLLETRFGLTGTVERAASSLEQIFDPQLFGTLGWHSPLVRVLRQVAPRYFGLLQALDRAADLPSQAADQGEDWREDLSAAAALAPPGVGSDPPERWVMALHRDRLQQQAWEASARQVIEEQQGALGALSQQQAALQAELAEVQAQLGSLPISHGQDAHPTENPKKS